MAEATSPPSRTSTEASVPAFPAEASAKYSFSIIDAIYLVSLLTLGPMMWLQMNSLWTRPHLQFFPMAWLAFAYFVYDRSPGVFTTTDLKRQLASVFLLAGSLLAAAEAVFISSPWLTYVAAVGIVTSWMLLRLGRLHWMSCIALTSLLWITVALPAGYDKKMIQYLQAISSYAASNFLDGIWITHLREGNILQLAGKRLFVDEACSGVDSLYALMAISLTIVLWFRQPLIVAVCALSMVPVWAGCSNVIRLISIVLAHEWLGLDLTSGMPHTILGLTTFVIAFTCDFAFICFLSALFEAPRKRTKEEMQGVRPWLHTFQKPKYEIVPNDRTGKGARGFTWAIPLVLSLCFAAIGAYSTRVLARGTTLQFPEFTVASLETLRGRLQMPPQLGNWRFQGAEAIQREKGNVMGQHSHVWVYEANGGVAMVSVDFPFRGFHLLDECYEGAGWKTNNPHMVRDQELPSSPYAEMGPLQVHLLDFIKDTGDFTYVAYMQFQLSGEPVRSAAVIRGMERFERTVLEPATYQVQAMFSSPQPISEAEREQVYRNLVSIADNIRPAFVGLETID